LAAEPDEQNPEGIRTTDDAACFVGIQRRSDGFARNEIWQAD
jgi:hypothetical protein